MKQTMTYLSFFFSFCAFAFSSVCVLGKSEVPSHWRAVESEAHTVQFDLGLPPVLYLTSGESTDYLLYPHSHAWSGDSRFVFFESVRLDPNGVAGNQLMAADSETGDLYWICSIPEGSNRERLGSQIVTSRKFHISHAPESGRFVIISMDASSVYIYEPTTGETRELFSFPEGAIGGSPDISTDGSRVLLWVSHEGNSSMPGAGERLYGFYEFEIPDEWQGDYVQPKLVGHFVQRTGEEDGKPFTINAAHTILHPTDANIFSFSHQCVRVKPDGSALRSTIWLVDQRSGEIKTAALTPKGRYHTHQVFGSKGESMYLVDTGDVVRLSLADFSVENLLSADDIDNGRPWHITVDAEEKFLAFDTQMPGEFDVDGTRATQIYLLDLLSGEAKLLARSRTGINHPYHPHPYLAYDASKVAFTEAMLEGNSRIGVVSTVP
ncbi:hypothetical protein ACWPKO_05190 [Coraliomargarita sp. W4R53]